MLKLKDGFILRSIAGEYVAVPVGGDLNPNMMITLNGTGSFLWERLTQGAEREDLVQALMTEYGIDTATARSAVDGFVEKLQENGFLA